MHIFLPTILCVKDNNVLIFPSPLIMTIKFNRTVSIILLSSLLLAQHVHAYSIDDFPGAAEATQRTASPENLQEVQFGERLQRQTYRIRISPISTDAPHITRAQFVNTIIESLPPSPLPLECFEKLSPSNYRLLFTDVAVESSFSPNLCRAMRLGLIKGYSDGSFHPYKPINIAEAAKILAKVYGIAPDPTGPSVQWYEPYVKALNERGAIPAKPLDSSLTVQDFAMMTVRLGR